MKAVIRNKKSFDLFLKNNSPHETLTDSLSDFFIVIKTFLKKFQSLN